MYRDLGQFLVMAVKPAIRPPNLYRRHGSNLALAPSRNSESRFDHEDFVPAEGSRVTGILRQSDGRERQAGQPPEPVLSDFRRRLPDFRWNKDKVKAESELQGLIARPDAENRAHLKDPDGFDLQISGKGMTA